MKNPTHTRTHDLFYAAYLLSQGARLMATHVALDGSKRVAFEFQSQRMRELNEDYLSGDAMVNLRTLKSSLHHLKDLIFKETKHSY